MILKRLLYLLTIVLVMNSCLEDVDDEIPLNHEFSYFKTNVVLDSKDRPLLISQGDTNGIVDTKWQFNYQDDVVIMDVYDGSDKLLEKKVFELDNYGSVKTSYDTVYKNSGFVSYKSSYTISDSGAIPSRKEIYASEVELGNVVAEGQYVYYYSMYSSDIMQVSKSDLYFGYCSDYYYISDSLQMKFDVQNPISFLENLNSGYVTFKIIHDYECSHGSAAETNYIYDINDDGYITKVASVYLPEFYGQSSLTATHTVTAFSYTFQ